ncbi:MAG: helix-turn-helix transcriptional regulator [Bacteroidota bacterium]
MTGHLDIIFAEKLRNLRNDKNEKQEATAIALGISQRDYSDLENGRVHFTEEMIRKIGNAFKIPVSAFKKIEHTPSLTGFLKTLADEGIIENGKEKINAERELEILMYKKTIKELQYEKSKLLWELNKSRAFTEKIRHPDAGNIYVII